MGTGQVNVAKFEGNSEFQSTRLIAAFSVLTIKTASSQSLT